MSSNSEEKIYKIGQAAKAVGLKSYVLRFWEGEFEQLKPIRTPSGQRLYNGEHLALVKRIKALLHDEGLTIEGARKRLDSPDLTKEDSAQLASPVKRLPLFSLEQREQTAGESVSKDVLEEVRDDLVVLLEMFD